MYRLQTDYSSLWTSAVVPIPLDLVILPSVYLSLVQGRGGVAFRLYLFRVPVQEGSHGGAVI